MPLFLRKYLLFLTIGFYLLLAVCIDTLFKLKYAWSGLTAISLGGIIYTFIPNPTNHSDISTMMSHIQDLNSQSKNKFYLCPDYRDLSFIYYYNRSWYKYANHPEGRMYVRRLLENDNIYPISSKAGVRVNEFVDFEEIIYIDAAADFSNPGNGILKTLEDSLSQKKKRHFDLHFEVYVFE